MNVSTTSPPLRRYLALWFPLLAIDRLQRERPPNPGSNPVVSRVEPPLAVIAKLRGVARLVAVDVKASARHLAPGLTLSDARARVPDLVVIIADPIADAELLAALAVQCERFTPQVAVLPPDGLTLDITGCEHLFGGEAALLDAVIGWLRRQRLTVVARIAPTSPAAQALARFEAGGPMPGDEDERLRALPVKALGIEPELVTALSRAGLKTLAELADRPAAPLAVRFGGELVSRLQQVLGHDDRRIVPLRAPPDYTVDRRFAEPLMQTDALDAILAELLAEAVVRLEARGSGGRVFEFSCFRSDGEVRRVTVETSRPSRDAKAIARLFAERLQTLADPLDPGFGFDAVRLAVPVAEPLGLLQPELDGSALVADAVADLVDRLVVRLGSNRVQRFVPRDTHDPVRAARLVPAQAARVVKGEWLTPETAPRPILLYDRPHPIETIAEVPDGPPIRFRWRRVVHHVTRAEGPERIAPEWWRQAALSRTRDYYRLEDQAGCRFWVFREGMYGDGERPNWFLHGLFA